MLQEIASGAEQDIGRLMEEGAWLLEEVVLQGGRGITSYNKKNTVYVIFSYLFVCLSVCLSVCLPVFFVPSLTSHQASFPVRDDIGEGGGGEGGGGGGGEALVQTSATTTVGGVEREDKEGEGEMEEEGEEEEEGMLMTIGGGEWLSCYSRRPVELKLPLLVTTSPLRKGKWRSLLTLSSLVCLVLHGQ